MLTAIASAAYERVCMLFNIAALQSQIGSIQNFDSDEGLKAAVKYFQVRPWLNSGMRMVLRWLSSDRTIRTVRFGKILLIDGLDRPC